MSRSKKSWIWEGRKIRERKNWDFEIEPEEIEDVKATPALSKVDVNLCYRTEVVLSTRGVFFVCWKERDPRTPPVEEFFTRDTKGRSEERIAEYRQLVKKHPPESYARKISARGAYEIIARFWLPRDFHAAAGLRSIAKAR